MENEHRNWYRSKLDWWLVPLLCLPPVVAIAVCSQAAIHGPTTDLLVGCFVALMVASVYFGLIFPLRYGFDESHLIVRHGVCRQRILLADISDVHPTRNPLSSPALSLDRLRIQFGQGLFKAVMISPADRDRFLDELAQRAGMQRQGDCLTRNRIDP